MSKRLTMSVCLAFALALSSGVARAGGHGGAMPAPQALAPSPQGIVPSAQGYVESYGYEEACPPKHCGFSLPKICLPKIHMPKICLPKIECKPKCYEYEWVLKKKRCGGGLLGGCNKHEECADYGYTYGGGEVYATEQYASPQAAAYPTSQVYGAGQAYAAPTYGSGQLGSGQLAPAPGSMEAAPAVESDEAPEAPVVPSAYGRLGSSLFGTNG